METLSSAPSQAARSGRPSISRGYLALFATVVIWSLPSLFQFYLLRYYDVWAQNFYRYSVACLAIAPFVAFHIRRGGPRLDLRAFALCLVPSLPNVVHQITQTVSLFYIGPGVYAIFTRSSVIMTALLALIFFPEERHILRQWQFQVGTLLGLLGAVGVFWFQPGTDTGHVAIRGLLIAFVATTCWALYGVLVKRPSAKLGSIRSFGLVSFITSTLLFPLTCAFGNVATPVHVTWLVNLILAVSAVTLHHGGPRPLLRCHSGNRGRTCPDLATPLSVRGPASFGLDFHEHLTIAQIWSAAILLFGAFLAMRVKPLAATETAENI